MRSFANSFEGVVQFQDACDADFFLRTIGKVLRKKPYEKISFPSGFLKAVKKLEDVLVAVILAKELQAVERLAQHLVENRMAAFRLLEDFSNVIVSDGQSRA